MNGSWFTLPDGGGLFSHMQTLGFPLCKLGYMSVCGEQLTFSGKKDTLVLSWHNGQVKAWVSELW